MLVDLRDTPLDLEEAMAHVRHTGAGAIDVFLGIVRDSNEGHAVTELDYSAYATMAKAEMTRIANGVEAEWPGVRTAVIHRVGKLVVGDVAVVCAVSAPHRGPAFEACRALIDRIKADVPIWKKEQGPDGATWVGWRP